MTPDERRERRTARLLEKLREAGGKPLGIREVMQRAGLHPGERTDVKRVLRDLAREGKLLRDGKRFAMPGASSARPEPGRPRPGARPRSGGGLPTLVRRRGLLGTLTRHRDGYGFVARLDRQGEDVFLPPEEAAKALSGDLVRLEIVPAPGGRTMGRVVEVAERRRRWAMGTYHARGRSSFVVPSDRDLVGQVHVPETPLAQDGDVVKVALEAAGDGLAGEVVERVGDPGDPRVEALRVAYGKGFSDLFPEEAREEAERAADRVLPEEREGRRDLTGLGLVTIDGEDARDFDDAVFVERVRKGKGRYRLVVAIADVAHYVRRGSALDAEALRRATSVYFPAQALPMLPERLSNGICSLNPEVDRLCMVADLLLDARGRPCGSEIYEGVMRSAARCTYTEVAGVLSGEEHPRRGVDRRQLELMAELQSKLGEVRAARGAIDFDLPERKVVLGERGEVLTIERRPRNRAHRIVEEFMLAANEAVARHFGESDLATIYRVHGLPDEEKLDAFRKLARAHGFEVPPGALGPKELNRLLHAFEGHAQQRALNQLLLRAMMQAVYSPENIGHYGLAAEHYLHFTSPIRRFPDLVVHRLLKEEWARRGAPHRESARELREIAALSSERERAAMQAEREVGDFYAALFLRDRIGERHPGVVASVVEFGLFVEIEPWFVEGLVKAEDLGEGFELDRDLHALVQRRTGRAFRVGDRVTVEIRAASPARRQVDLALVEEGSPPTEAIAPRQRKGAARGERKEPRAPRRGKAGKTSKAGNAGKSKTPRSPRPKPRKPRR